MSQATIRDVAALAGCSPATASRVLSGHPSTSATSRERVEAAARELDFRPNAQARSLRRTRTDTIGVIVSDIRNPFFAEIAHRIEQRAFESQIATLLCSADENVEQQDRYLDLLVTQRVDALVLAPQGDGSGSLQDVLSREIPVVFVDRTISGLDVPSVTSDNVTGIVQALDHLHRLGHRRIGYVAGPQQTSTGRERRTAFEGRAAQLGLDLQPELIYPGDFQHASGVRGARALLDLPEPPTAIIAADSLMTFGVLAVCRERSIAVPDELSVVGYDDLDAFALVTPSLTVVAHDAALMGDLATDAVGSLLAGRPAATKVLPASLIVRESSGPAPSSPRTATRRTQP